MLTKHTAWTVGVGVAVVAVGATFGAGGTARAQGTAAAPRPPGATSSASGARRIVHVPANEVSHEGAELWFWASDPDRLGQIVVELRPTAGGPTTELVAVRGDEGWFVRLTPKMLPLGGVSYWVVERMPDGSERPVFASARDPHEVTVRQSVLAAYERRRVKERRGRRNRAILSGEYVGLGKRTIRVGGADKVVDELYWRAEASYEYSFFWAVDSVRIHVGRLRGEVVNLNGPAVGASTVGLDYGSADIVWRAHDLLRFRTSVTFGFSQEGFELGGGAAMVIGEPQGTSLTLGVDGVTGLGVTGRLRLGWLVVPRLPMGATIEVTTFPLADEPGMRLLLDAAYEIYPGAYLKIVGGYRGWTSTAGGASIGAEMAFAF